MSEKIEPTDAMVDEAANGLCLEATGTSLRFHPGGTQRTYRNKARTILRAALNHPDARGLFADEDDRPWEPLGDDEPLSMGDEVKQAHHGITTIAVVGGVDKRGNARTAGGSYIGNRLIGTWYVRRHVEDLPTEPGAVIVANDGHDAVEAIGPFGGTRWHAREAVLGRDGRWHAAWRRDAAHTNAAPCAAPQAAPECITPGTWKVESK